MSHDVYKVFLDANILHSKTLRDWIFLLSLETGNEFFRVYTSQGVIDEYSYHWCKQHPISTDRARLKVVKQIRESVFKVVEGFPVEPVDGYPDEHDLHVHAAAEFSEVDALITNDKKLIAFGASTAGEALLSYDTLSADDFLMQLAEFLPPTLPFKNVYLFQEKYALSRKHDTNLCESLRRAGAPQFAEFIHSKVYLRLV
ncbi:PIN domain-containing protein [Rothia terrae]|uniref:PIN domain-containing protein n=1 Tax=Rothia terrae TaxID=396015 RepID=UPI0028829871|nr:PIN domain-containing protein [Rothia terrae]MDT0189213.1 PIN domain-containing protein [Rothia terrae]